MVANGKKMEKRSLAVARVKMRDYANDPFVVRKTQQATEFIKKHGLPERSIKR
ncbi:hypothetical protein [Filimonas effusa]|uniref:hypothetical protein n=1 Tax=Filimonas effusa TaxID=2508721 RepID=UPI0013E96805|nr:hypothetical protein [Filimonas effusa]